ncbi:MAG: AMP phosphorylase [Candidatus Ranarchaeia archaeon]
MKFVTKHLDIASNQNSVLLNINDAKKFGLKKNDRIKIKISSNEISGIVSTTSVLVHEGTIGLFTSTWKKLGQPSNKTVEVRLAAPAKSLPYIKKKTRGSELSKEEIHEFVNDVVNGNLSRLEIASFVMAEQFKGMTLKETEIYTKAISEAGEMIDFDRPVYDKHSIGGVPGNKVTLLIVPTVAAGGLLIPKTSSRAITSPSGTGDSMEVLANVQFEGSELKRIANKVGGCIVWGGSLNFAPADDIIIQVEKEIMIDPRAQMMASIMAKKLSMGVDYLVLDIPTGVGAKVETLEKARDLSRDFVALGMKLGIKVECGITYGGQPVGHAVGPALEAKEALEVLSGKGPKSVIEKSNALSGVLFEMSGKAVRGEGMKMATELLRKGKSMKKMREIIEEQGGNPNITPEEIPIGKHKATIKSPIDGFIVNVDNKAINLICRRAGAPQEKGSGIVLTGKRGYKINRGDIILEIYAERASKLKDAVNLTEKLKPILVEGMLLEKITELS